MLRRMRREGHDAVMMIRCCEMSLFDVPDEYHLAHCISSDFALGKGIAKEFVMRFNTKRMLHDAYGGYYAYFIENRLLGDCLKTGRVLNLVTKVNYYDKPTLMTMRVALTKCRMVCKINGIRKIAMPKIGCGLDRLKWDDVQKIVSEVFENTDIEIVVCCPQVSAQEV